MRLYFFSQIPHIDMATAEALAWVTLNSGGFGVRLSGQDSQRGTFSHRHSILHDQKIDNTFCPFHQLLPDDKKHLFQAYNSHLSEYGVLGFEYGYSISNPNVLVMWEAQFGDFANGAQIMIDNFVASGEAKWGVQSGLVMILPHGLDGQGPEHSSARIERFLQLSDDDYSKIKPGRTEKIKKSILNNNWQIVYCSNSVNYFHALRRQIRRTFRKPLVAFTSKKLLRHKGASSPLEQFEKQIRFATCYDEQFPNDIVSPQEVKRLVVCSGQVYYDILEQRQKREVKDMAIVRLEQLVPFPYDYFKVIVQRYPNAQIVWCQEEHINQGAWFYFAPRANRILNEILHVNPKAVSKTTICVGRKPSISPATGSMKQHLKELNELMKQIFKY